MSLQLWHQVGHNSNWNIDSFEQDHCGDGLILSPLHQSAGAVARLQPSTRSSAIFDPQFYLPSSRKPKLLGYDFFPESVGAGFLTSSFSAHAQYVAESCLAFQREQGFRNLVVPTRFLAEMYSNYIDRQRQFTVDAFMEAASGDSMTMSLAVTAAMVEDEQFRTRLLNWISSYPNVDCIYLILQQTRDTKQVHDTPFLRAALRFFQDVIRSGLSLIVGYANTENLIYATAGDIGVSMGAFENTRIFSLEKFVVSEEDRRGPKARIFLPGLLNWVQFGDARTIRTIAPDIWQRVYEPSRYSEEVLRLGVEPTFNQPQLYKHYFINTHDAFAEMRPLSVGDRRELLRERIQAALRAYEALSSRGIELERHGRGTHLSSWLAALN